MTREKPGEDDSSEPPQSLESVWTVSRSFKKKQNRASGSRYAASPCGNTEQTCFSLVLMLGTPTALEGPWIQDACEHRRTRATTRAGEAVRKGSPSTPLGGLYIGATAVESGTEVPQKTKHRTTV